LRKGVVDIPLLFLMDALIPLYGCMTVQPIVDTIALIVAIYFYRRILADQKTQSDILSSRQLALHMQK
jgi:hypothetical protein